MPDGAALLLVVQTAIDYRRAREANQRAPMPSQYWQAVCAALDALAVVGAKNEVQHLDIPHQIPLTRPDNPA